LPFLMMRTSPLWVVIKTRVSGATAMAVVLPMLFAIRDSLKPVGRMVGVTRSSSVSSPSLDDCARLVFFPPRIASSSFRKRNDGTEDGLAPGSDAAGHPLKQRSIRFFWASRVTERVLDRECLLSYER